MELERVQSQVAKALLGVPSNSSNTCAQSELGMFPFRMCLYKCQLQFYFRILALPASRWVKQALLDHLSLLWPSPYLQYMVSIRDSVSLPYVPPTSRYLSVHLAQWAIAETNFIIGQQTLPCVGQLTKFVRQPYVFEHDHLDTIAQFRLSNAGLGNRCPRFVTRRTSCPLCTSLHLSEGHVVFFCPSVEQYREEFDLAFFRGICTSKGFTEEMVYVTFVNGFDWNGNRIQVPSGGVRQEGTCLGYYPWPLAG